MAHFYFVMKNPGVEDRILIWDTRTLSIGRSEENDLTLDDEEVSRKHAHLSNENGEFEIGDYRTGNGTFVNGKRVSQSKKIRPGDVIAIGKVQMEFIEGQDHPAGLGLKVDFASHLKTMGMLPQGQDAGATMLGLVDAADDEDFVVEPERGSGGQAFMVGEDSDPAFQMRELDDSLNDMQFDLDDPGSLELDSEIEPPPETRPLELELELDDGPPATPPPPTRPRPAPQAAPAAAKEAPAAASDPGSSAGGADPTERLRKLKVLHDEGLITDQEFQAKKAAIIDAM